MRLCGFNLGSSSDIEGSSRDNFQRFPPLQMVEIQNFAKFTTNCSSFATSASFQKDAEEFFHRKFEVFL